MRPARPCAPGFELMANDLPYSHAGSPLAESRNAPRLTRGDCIRVKKPVGVICSEHARFTQCVQLLAMEVARWT